MLKLFCCGNVVADADLVNVTRNDGTPAIRSKFTVAVNRHSKTRGEEAVYVNVTLWDNYAKNVQPYIKKGTKVTLEGDFSTYTYTKQTGGTQTNLEMSNPAIEITSSKQEQPVRQANQTVQPAPAPQVTEPQNFTAVEEDIDNGLPF